MEHTPVEHTSEEHTPVEHTPVEHTSEEHTSEQHPVDLVAALARARSPEHPGTDTPAGPAVRAWPGPPRTIPGAAPGELDVEAVLRLSLAASDGSGRLRPAPSAGALHPVDAELVVGEAAPCRPAATATTRCATACTASAGAPTARHRA
ncbi:hypothetical protein LUW77_26835 [Streptomyces radiopugnans]|nr:hypothetical protein LUW77_26835 [Streptomyces radiopugnans]